MQRSLGYRIELFIRTRVENLKLGNIALGKWRRLTTYEVSELKKLYYGS